MGEVFLKVLNMSATAGWLILAVLLIRCLLRKAPKWVICALWGLVAIRLVFPFSIESMFSLIPRTESLQRMEQQFIHVTHPEHTVLEETMMEQVDVSKTDSPASVPDRISTVSSEVTASKTDIGAVIWLSGMIVLFGYALLGYIRLKRRVEASVCVEGCIMECDEIQYSFILGVIKPLIYLPSSIHASSRQYVVAHETAHLKRRDHWWKPFAYLLLCVHWFNPFCWISYILFCRDLEMACDERVIRDMDKESRVGYSQTLLNLSKPGNCLSACPLAFGEVGVKERVKGIIRYKKPAIWVILLSMVICAVVTVCFLTNPAEPIDVVGEYVCDVGEDFNNPYVLIKKYGTFQYQNGGLSSHIGQGMWEIKGKRLILTEYMGEGPKKIVFTYKEGDLIYNRKESDIKMDNWDRFVKQEASVELIPSVEPEPSKEPEASMEETKEVLIREGYLMADAESWKRYDLGDLDQNGVKDYVICGKNADSSDASKLYGWMLYLNEEMIYQCAEEVVAFSPKAQLIDLDEDGQEELFFQYTTHLNDLLDKFVVLKKMRSGWAELENPRCWDYNEETWCYNSFPVYAFRTEDLVIRIDCEGVESFTVDLREYYEKFLELEGDGVHSHTLNKILQGSGVDYPDLWGIAAPWGIRSLRTEQLEDGRNCIVARQAIESLELQKYDVFGEMDFYFNYDSEGKIQIIMMDYFPLEPVIWH